MIFLNNFKLYGHDSYTLLVINNFSKKKKNLNICII